MGMMRRMNLRARSSKVLLRMLRQVLKRLSASSRISNTILNMHFYFSPMKSFSLLSFLLVFIIGCGGGGGDKTSQYGLSTKNNVVWWNLSDIEKLNPYLSTDANAAYVEQLIWEPLNFQHPVTLELLPGLADTVQLS